MYTAIDLFAGAGGLSLGFLQTKKFDIKVAFENSPYMQDTYRQNHPGIEVLGDVCTADYQAIEKKYGKIDVVIGGPPCQGFSNANRQKNHAISSNNMLVRQYVRAILELKPKAFVMENVSMLHSETHRFYLSKSDVSIVKQYQIPTKETALPLLDQEYYFGEATEIIKKRKTIEKYLWPEKQYLVFNVIYKTAKNTKKLRSALEKHKEQLQKYCEAASCENDDNDPIFIANAAAIRAIQAYYKKTISEDKIKAALAPAIMIQRMLGKATEIIDNDLVVERYDCANGLTAVIKSFSVFDYLVKTLEAKENGYIIAKDVLCAANYGAPQKRMRYVMMGIQKTSSSKVALPRGSYDEDQYRTVKDAIGDLEEVPPFINLEDDVGIPLEKREGLNKLANSLRDAKLLRNHITTKTTEVAMKRFRALKQGENFHALDENLKTNTYSDASRTQNTIYLRLNYNEPCGTVVNVRKSMWIHPTKDRAISVREAARLQTFPDSFVFCGSKDKQYQQVGNAVPPIMAKAIAKKLASLLMKGEAEAAEVV